MSFFRFLQFSFLSWISPHYYCSEIEQWKRAVVIREVEGREKEDYSALSSFSHHLRLILKGQGSPFFLSFSAYINLPLETTYHQGQSTKGLNMLKFNKSYYHSSFRFVFNFILILVPRLFHLLQTSFCPNLSCVGVPFLSDSWDIMVSLGPLFLSLSEP